MSHFRITMTVPVCLLIYNACKNLRPASKGEKNMLTYWSLGNGFFCSFQLTSSLQWRGRTRWSLRALFGFHSLWFWETMELKGASASVSEDTIFSLSSPTLRFPTCKTWLIHSKLFQSTSARCWTGRDKTDQAPAHPAKKIRGHLYCGVVLRKKWKWSNNCVNYKFNYRLKREQNSSFAKSMTTKTWPVLLFLRKA